MNNNIIKGTKYAGKDTWTPTLILRVLHKLTHVLLIRVSMAELILEALTKLVNVSASQVTQVCINFRHFNE